MSQHRMGADQRVENLEKALRQRRHCRILTAALSFFIWQIWRQLFYFWISWSPYDESTPRGKDDRWKISCVSQDQFWIYWCTTFIHHLFRFRIWRPHCIGNLNLELPYNTPKIWEACDDRFWDLWNDGRQTIYFYLNFSCTDMTLPKWPFWREYLHIVRRGFPLCFLYLQNIFFKQVTHILKIICAISEIIIEKLILMNKYCGDFFF
jgi:hypothetical protein